MSYDSWSGYGVRVVREAQRELDFYPDKVIHCPADVFDLLGRKMSYYDRELFVTVVLNARNKVLGINTVSVGSLSASIVHPREVFRPVVVMEASSIILAHNHPSSDVSPSEEDLTVTHRLKDAGELLGIQVLDHLIIGDGKFLSLNESGQI